MNRHYAMRLLREVREDPSLLVRRRKYWKLPLFDWYLERCNELLFATPVDALALARLGPAFAARVARANPEAAGSILELRAYAILGSVYRVVEDYESAEDAFAEALAREADAPAVIAADLYRRLAYLRLYQHRPEAFSLIGEAMAIHKRGDLVDRHGLGECLLCRGHAHFSFGDPGRSLQDLSAALNHLSLRRDPRPYYAALYNLGIWAVEHGTDEVLARTLENLEPALHLLNAYHRRHFAKYKLRWLIALIQGRLGHTAQAELTYRAVRAGLLRLRLPYEVAMLTIDWATLVLPPNRRKVRPLLKEAITTFRQLGRNAAAEHAVHLLAPILDEPSHLRLKEIRHRLAEHTQPSAVLAA